MAAIERVTVILPTQTISNLPLEGGPGLRIAIRSTTSSLSDYPEWSLEELYQQYRDNLITDGTCS